MIIFYVCASILIWFNKVESLSQIKTLVGSGTGMSTGDGGPASSATINYPDGIFIDSTSTVFVSEYFGGGIRKIEQLSGETGIISTFKSPIANPSGVFGDSGGKMLYVSSVGTAVLAVNMTTKSVSEQMANLHPKSIWIDNFNSNMYLSSNQLSTIYKQNMATGIISLLVPNNNGAPGDGGPASSATISSPSQIYGNNNGKLFITESFNNKIRVIDLITSIITTFAGVGPSSCLSPTPGGEGGAATSANLCMPDGVWGTTTNMIYIANYRNRLRGVTPTGIMVAIAGSGIETDGVSATGANGDGGALTSAQFGILGPLSVDTSGFLYVVEKGSNKVRMIYDFPSPTAAPSYPPSTPPKQITTIAGNGDASSSGVGGPATSASIYSPESVWCDSQGRVYISDFNGNMVLRIGGMGLINTYAGTGQATSDGDGGKATAAIIQFPSGIFGDSAGNSVYLGDFSASAIRRVDQASSIITQFVYQTSTRGIWADSSDTYLYSSTSNSNRVYRYTIATLTMHRLVSIDGIASSTGDGGAASSATLNSPFQIWGDNDKQKLYIAEQSGNKIRVVDLISGIISTFAGTGQSTGQGNNGPATSAGLMFPEGVWGISGGVIYITTRLHQVHAISLNTGIITCVAGTVQSSVASSANGDGGSPSSAMFNYPAALFVDSNGFIYVAEKTNNKVRKIYDYAPTSLPTPPPTIAPSSAPLPPPQQITTVLGIGINDFTGDGGHGTSASISSPKGVWADSAAGNMYVSDFGSNRVRKLTGVEGIVSLFFGHNDDTLIMMGNPASATSIVAPYGLFGDAYGEKLFVADGDNRRIRTVNFATTIVETLLDSAGEVRGIWSNSVNGDFYYASTLYSQVFKLPGSNLYANSFAGVEASPDSTGDGGPASSAQLAFPHQIYGDSHTNKLYICEKGDAGFGGRIRVINLSTGIISTFAGGPQTFTPQTGRATSVFISEPEGVWGDTLGTIYISFTNHQKIMSVGADNNVVLVAGTTVASSVTTDGNGDGGSPTSATFFNPGALFVDTLGAIFVCDQGNHKIRKIYDFAPTNMPTPSPAPSLSPTPLPTSQPSRQPTGQPSGQPLALPTSQPSRQHSRQPTSQPSKQPTGQPSRQPSAQPSAQPSSLPTTQPSCQPSSQPSTQPVSKPSGQPSIQPISFPSSQPSSQPSVQPSGQPSSLPSSQPSCQPSSQPSTQPVVKPSGQPSIQPISFPSSCPSIQPSSLPSSQPSGEPSAQPSTQPSSRPSSCPSKQPSSLPSGQPSSEPTMLPSAQPTGKPSSQPDAPPSSAPSCAPSSQPSTLPTLQPSSAPSSQPASCPTSQPTGAPSTQPTITPSTRPTTEPSGQPTSVPSQQPLSEPSSQPSVQPQSDPTSLPSTNPTTQPSSDPSTQPTGRPSTPPSGLPSSDPSAQPSCAPTMQPSGRPSTRPSEAPSSQPSTSPTTLPSSSPSSLPSALPSLQPSSEPSTQPSSAPSQAPLSAPSSQPSSQPSIEPFSAPSIGPSTSPSAQPSSFPSSIPSSSPSTLPSGHPSSQPLSDPTGQPVPEPTSHPTTQPSAQPSGQPSRQPTGQPTRQPSVQPTAVPSLQAPSATHTAPPSMPTSIQWVEALQKTQKFVRANISSAVVHQTVYSELNVAGNSPTFMAGGCTAWSSMISADLDPSSYLFKATSLQLTVQSSLRKDAKPVMRRCSEAPYVNQLVSFLRGDNTTTKTSISVKCSNHTWRASFCADSTLPSICVDCTDPCAASAHCVNDKNIAEHPFTISPCGSEKCSPASQIGSAVRVLSVDYEDYNPAPAILRSSVKEVTKNAVSMSVTLSSVGVVYCGAFRYFAQQPGLNTVPVNIAQITQQSFFARSGVVSGDEVAVVTLPNLIAATNYTLYCVASSSSATSSMTAVLATAQVAKTACCKTIVVKTSAATVSAAQNVRSFLTLTLDAAPTSSLQVTVTLVNNATKTVVPGAIVPSTFNVEPSTSNKAVVLSGSLAAQTAGVYFVSVTLSGASADEYLMTHKATNNMDAKKTMLSVLTSNSATLPAPVLSSAVFASDGAYFAVSFDSNTNKGNTSTQFTCAQLFNFACVDTAKCRWADSATVYVSGSCASVGSAVTLATNAVIKAQCNSANSAAACDATNWPSTPLSSTVQISSPALLQLPKISISAPSVVGQCSALLLDLSGSTGSGGRPWEVDIVVSASPQTPSAVASVVAVQEFLNQHFAISPPTSIPWQLLSSGVTYSFEVTLCNFLDACSQAVIRNVAVSAAIPTVSLPGPALRTTTRSANLTVNSNAYVSGCDDAVSYDGLTHSWVVTVSGVAQPLLTSTSKDTSKFLLPAYSLTVGVMYTVTLTTTVTSTQKSASSSVQVFVQQGRVVSSISGGRAQTTNEGSSVLLDASNSRDEDVTSSSSSTSTGLLFLWSCVQMSPVLSVNCSDIFENYNSIAKTESKFAAEVRTGTAGRIAEISVTVFDASRSRSSVSSVTLTVLPSLSPLVTVSSDSVDGVVNSDQVVKLFGSVSVPANTAVELVWSVDETTLVDLNKVALSPVVTSLPAAASIRLMDIFMVIGANTLPTGASLGFSVSCKTASGRISTAMVTIEVNSPPQFGSFTVSKVNPQSSTVPSYVFWTENWSDDDTPLTYQFGYISPSGAQTVLLSQSLASYGTATIPPGLESNGYVVACFATVFDKYNANTTVTFDVTVPQISSEEQDVLLDTMLSSAAVSMNVNSIKQANSFAIGLMNIVDCSGAADCAALNRAPCFQTTNMCGECISSDFVGDFGDSNTQCVEAVTAGTILRRLTTASECTSTEECGLFQTCEGGKCLAPTKKCTSNCNNRGVCAYVNVDSGLAVSECLVGDATCNAACVCDSNYTGTYDCRINIAKLLVKQAHRFKAVQNLASLMDREDADAQSVGSWMSTLSEAAQSSDELSVEAQSLVLELCDSLLGHANQWGLSVENMQVLLRSIDLVTKASANTYQQDFRRLGEGISSHRRRLEYINTVSRSQSALQQYNDVVLSGMLPGQFPLTMLYSQFRSVLRASTAATDGSNNMSVSIPQSYLEMLNGIKPSAVNVPHSSAPVKLSLTAMQSSLYQSEFDSNLRSNPLTMSMSAHPKCTSPPCRIEVELQFSTALNRSELFPESPEKFTHTCRENVVESFNYTCASNQTVSLSCNGTARVLHTSCPYTSYSPVCNTLLGSSNTLNLCSVVSSSATGVVCSCMVTGAEAHSSDRRRVLQSGTNTTSDGYTASYVSMLSAVENSFLTTVTSADNLGLHSLKTGWRAIVTIGTFAAAILAAMLFSHLADEKIGKKALKDKEGREKKSTFIESIKNIGRGTKRIKPSDLKRLQERETRKRKTVKNADLIMVEESLPSVLSSQALSQRVVNEIKQHHRWLAVVFFYSETFPRVLRVVSLATNIIIMLFIQSLTYTLTNPDDGSCEKLVSKPTCTEPLSAFATGESKCSWDYDYGKCSFIQPNASIKIILFVAIFSAIVSTPIAIAVDWIVRSILSANTIKQSKVGSGAGGNSDGSRRLSPVGQNTTALTVDGLSPVASGTSGRRRAVRTTEDGHATFVAQGELRALSAELVAYRQELTAAQRIEFDLMWGVDEDGNFFGKTQHDQQTTLNTIQRLCNRLRSGRVKEHPDVQQIVLDDLARVISATETECKVLESSAATKRQIGKRLLFLFQCDLLPGISGQILQAKDQRDVLTAKRVSFTAKVLGWTTIFLLNAGMIFYIFLFALNESEERQGAWFQSFILWLVVEILVVSSAVVLLTHILIPLLTMRDVTKIKQRLMDSIQTFHEGVAKKKEMDCDPSHLVKAELCEEQKVFNAASYLFVSSRVATKYPALKESQIIAQFSTPWPRQSYQRVVDMSKKYSKKFAGLARALNIVAVFTLANLLNVPAAVQDMVIQMATTATIGYSMLLHIQLYTLFPLLAFVPLLLICVAVHFMIQSGKANAKLRLAKLMPKHETPGGLSKVNTRRRAGAQPVLSATQHVSQHVSRRISMKKALSVARDLQICHEQTDNNNQDESALGLHAHPEDGDDDWSDSEDDNDSELGPQIDINDGENSDRDNEDDNEDDDNISDSSSLAEFVAGCAQHQEEKHEGTENDFGKQCCRPSLNNNLDLLFGESDLIAAIQSAPEQSVYVDPTVVVAAQAELNSGSVWQFQQSEPKSPKTTKCDFKGSDTKLGGTAVVSGVAESKLLYQARKKVHGDKNSVWQFKLEERDGAAESLPNQATAADTKNTSNNTNIASDSLPTLSSASSEMPPYPKHTIWRAQPDTEPMNIVLSGEQRSSPAQDVNKSAADDITYMSDRDNYPGADPYDTDDRIGFRTLSDFDSIVLEQTERSRFRTASDWMSSADTDVDSREKMPKVGRARANTVTWASENENSYIPAELDLEQLAILQETIRAEQLEYLEQLEAEERLDYLRQLESEDLEYGLLHPQSADPDRLEQIRYLRHLEAEERRGSIVQIVSINNNTVEGGNNSGDGE